MTPVVVVDTNVVVSGLLTQASQAPTRRILDAMLVGSIRFLLSIELVTEYREVMLRPRIVARHGLSEHEIDTVLEVIALNGMLRSITLRIGEGPDPGDAHLWALLETHPGAVLVTGDQALVDRPPAGAFVASPREYWGSFLQAGGR